MARDPGRRPGDGSGPDDAAPGANPSPVPEEARDVPGAQAPEAPSDQRRLRRLLDAVVAISADLDTEAVLHHIVEAAADLVATRYGALGVLGESGAFTDLITVGIDDPRLCAAMGLPQGHGVLRTLVADRQSLRVSELAAHPDAVGFPEGHPVMTTLLGVPLMVRDTVYGDLYLADKRDGTPFTDDDEVLLAALASAASVSIENARLYEHLKHSVEHFQRSMLPALPDLAPIEVRARYQPASRLPKLGGDWYDALPLPDGATGVVVGDVTGHDVEAAPLMGQIRNMLRALAHDRGGPPSLVVSKLDAALTMFGPPPVATLVFGRIEGGADVGYTFRWTNAGHPPPLVVTPDGATRYLAPARHGIPVGIEPSVPRFDHAHPLPPGATLLLFTDGLVERRDEDIDVGLRALAEHASRLVGAPVDVLCDELMAGRGQKFDDDVALLLLRLPGTAGS
ncbi:GAF domain-containing SpoIIE family protein phosphatase [Streptomyces sparsogenes]|uniref:PP2C family protein-serine/threonine phosphatase n=1 Tax=Streptomyces sparsogenes TaxID=67365 RepID=UPI003328A27A